jgi:hypothetical protein
MFPMHVLLVERAKSNATMFYLARDVSKIIALIRASVGAGLNLFVWSICVDL